MATRGMLSLTMKDYLKRLGPDHQIGPVVEILDETNEINDDAMYLQANNINTHRTVIRTGLPEAYWRYVNQGVPTSKSATKQVDDKIGMLEAWSVVDASLAALNGTTREFMYSEEYPFIEVMGQTAARTIFYGDLAVEPAAFQGLTPRYSTQDKLEAANAENVLDYGGTGANCTSIWLLVWGDQSLHMIYPKGSELGLKREKINGGQPMPVPDENGNDFMAYKTHYKWDLGLTLRDWHYCVRICNVDMNDLAAITQGGAATPAMQKLGRIMTNAYNLVPNINRGRAAFYMNRDCRTIIDHIASEKNNVMLSIEQFEGKKIASFKGIPIRRCDCLGAESIVPPAP